MFAIHCQGLNNPNRSVLPYSMDMIGSQLLGNKSNSLTMNHLSVMSAPTSFAAFHIDLIFSMWPPPLATLFLLTYLYSTNSLSFMLHSLWLLILYCLFRNTNASCDVLSELIPDPAILDRLIKINDKATLSWSSYLSSFGMCECTGVGCISFKREILVDGNASVFKMSWSFLSQRDTGTRILSS